MLVSVITINFNNAEGLTKTIKSVLNQNFSQIEYLVIDGGSSDVSKKIIEMHSDKLSYWVSEKDGGIYNAMNKGIVKARGEYLLFLNSGDFLKDGDAISYLLTHGNSADIIYGDILLQKNNDAYIPNHYPPMVTFKFFLTNSLPHASALIKRSLFSLVGLYDETMKICADWEFYLLALNKYNCSYQHVNRYITIFDFSGISAQKKSLPLIEEERAKSLQKYFPMFIADYNDYKKIQNEISEIKKSLWFRARHKLSKLFFTGF